MQSSLILLLIFCFTLSLQGYYFGFIRPPAVLAWPTAAICDVKSHTFCMAALWAEPAAGDSCPVRIYGTLFLVSH